MTSREKFRALMRFETVPDGYLPQEIYFWETIRRWYGEGLPASSGYDASFPYETASADDRTEFSKIGQEDIERYFAMDKTWRWVLPQMQQTAFRALPEPVVTEDDGTYLTLKQGLHIWRVYKNGHNTMTYHLQWPAAGRKDWETLRDEVSPRNVNAKLPQDWRDNIDSYPRADYPVAAYASLYGGVRNLFGPERLFYLFYDDPDLVREVVETFGQAIYHNLVEVFDNHHLDLFLWSEDFCYKAGPLFSYEIFREFFLPTYRRINSMLAEHELSCIMMETDGDCRQAVPWMIEAGATGIWPFECTNGQNVVDVRKEYPDLQIFRGIDKKIVASGVRGAIDEELESKLPFMLTRGGYLPGFDHAVPHDVSFDSYRYYRERLRELSTF